MGGALPTSTTTMTLMVVIPTYNERENIAVLVDEVLVLGDAVRVLIVDDASPDGTGEIADDLARQHPGRVDVLHRAGKEGLGRAYVAGFQHALGFGTTHIAQMDADHSHRPEDLRAMMQVAVQSGVDLVLGSRYIEGGETIGWPWHRRLISRIGGGYAGLILGVPIRDLTGGFKLWKSDTLRDIDLPTIHADGYGFQIETTYRALRRQHSVAQVPIVFHDRVAGASKLSRRVVVEAAMMVWPLRLRQLFGRPW
ncbi:MAG TPA: polyprenol monophosphomannose synthase [Thermomicrobiales bacterium]|nr:polyprenol monophosphomannose synthase [Thermomicrobiales bacterium]